jgi:hypothetical protein
MVLQNYFPCLFEAERNFKFAGKDVDCAQRQNAETRFGKSIRNITDAIENFVERAVAACGNKRIKSFPHRLGSERSRLARERSRLANAIARECFEQFLEPLRFLAASCWIEDDANAHAPMLCCLGKTGNTRFTFASANLF